LSTERKRTLFGAALLVIGLWPAVQIGLVMRYDVSPWKLGGFAMYATPPARTRVSIFETRGRPKTRFEGDLPTALAEQRRLYTVRRAILGSLLPPDGLAEAYLQARPDVDHIEVVIQREMLSASTARIERRESRYVYNR